MLDDAKFAKDFQKAINEWTKALSSLEKARERERSAKNRLMIVLMSKFASIFGTGKKSKGTDPVVPFMM